MKLFSKRVVPVVAVLLLMLGWVSPSQAAPAWFIATVSSAGSEAKPWTMVCAPIDRQAEQSESGQ